MAKIAFAGQSVKLRCPNCRSASLQLVETIEEHVIYDVVNGVMPQEATDHEAGSAIGLAAECAKCSHKWRPRATLLSEVLQD